MQQLPLINPDSVSEEEVATYRLRRAARAVVTDAEGKVALLHVSKLGFYKLPGGGIEEGEEIIEALKRECIEEIGCEVEVVGEVGTLTEYRREQTLKQTSYCYLALVVGDKGTPNLEQGEADSGFQTVWLSVTDARAAFSGSTLDDYEAAKYIVPRDTAFLNATGL